MMKKTLLKPPQSGHGATRKTIAIVGGILGLEPGYRRILEENNFLPKIFNQDSAGLVDRIKSTDAIILFTATVSHKMAEKIRKIANLRAIPLINVQRSSISALRRSVGDFS
jgi:hypothetical protein